MLRVERVSKQFDHSPTPLFSDINLSLGKGQSLAIMGASGSGKSTLLNMIAGLSTCSSGRIFLADQTISIMSEDKRDSFRAEHIGMVFQQFNLIDCLCVEDNILLPARYLGIPPRRSVDELLAALGITTLKRASIDKLSGGEQQRVAIARALIHSPSLILADEPTGNLDENTSNKVADLLFALAKETSASLLVVTHAPDVAKLADETRMIYQGSLQPI
ncbi:ABC transporter ATP-binding protein [Alteromonas sediminis]|uniref:ABC transporter ATP-binding protein n=1 Tax=Alteromonas sediminis TaxID=2259342 RepID=A0A3N5XYL8_9ALTE|nr:ABC transporter ATP-binding protein [Alteromonas sediminis]RPJ65700.1 ABC transporter ATP-binding protein [Alteromonas sediminis]